LSYSFAGYTLIIDNDGPALAAGLNDRMVRTFFDVYPRMARDFNPAARRTVTFSIDADYPGVAATAGGTVRFSASHLRHHPRDIDVITHEVMHIVQAYPVGHPVWLIEGIADYARYKYGVDNAGGGWLLPDYQPNQSYMDAYGVTARFLLWTEIHRHSHLVKLLDAALRSHTYSPDIWRELTGETVEKLWSMYGRHPRLRGQPFM
jgi:hypothetical protein